MQQARDKAVAAYRSYLERKKRDARIMTIYEGTNQVQRFSIVRDLVDEILPRWKIAAKVSLPRSSGHADSRASTRSR